MPSLIKTPAVERKSAKKKSWIYDAQARALFPKSVSPGTWVEQEIDHFIDLKSRLAISAYVERRGKISSGAN